MIVIIIKNYVIFINRRFLFITLLFEQPGNEKYMKS